MPDIRNYPSMVLAQQAADYLRAQGILATVIGTTDAFPGVGLHPLSGRFTIVIGEPAERDRATALLNDFDSESGITDADWEQAAAPDLSQLDPRTQAPCPKCAQLLPLDAALKFCPACRAPVDVVQILLDRYGPELLAACYPEHETEIPDDIVDAAALGCPRCAYPIRGLPAQGNCPECGLAYDKRALLRGKQASPESHPITCESCRYPLTGLAEVGVCPECFRPYSKAQMRRNQRP